MPVQTSIRKRELRNLAIEQKTYWCAECERGYRDTYTLTQHLNSRKHKPRQTIVHTFHCELCAYTTNKKQNLETHCKSARHQRRLDGLTSESTS